MFLIISL